MPSMLKVVFTVPPLRSKPVNNTSIPVSDMYSVKSMEMRLKDSSDSFVNVASAIPSIQILG